MSAERLRSTHNVRRIWSAGYEEIPCYCDAPMDHFIGNEVSKPMVFGGDPQSPPDVPNCCREIGGDDCGECPYGQ